VKVKKREQLAADLGIQFVETFVQNISAVRQAFQALIDKVLENKVWNVRFNERRSISLMTGDIQWSDDC
jgi:hypothetical protein